MAYKLMKEAGIYAASGYEYVCDAQSDISSLPTNSFGARALVIEDGSVWVLNSGNTWVKQAGSGGGGGGGGGSSVVVTPLSVTNNGTYTAPSGSAYSPVTVNVAGSAARMIAGGVNFIDYDGTVVYSYTVDEFMEMSEMPPNPVHEGLTSQGWNWTLADAKTQLTAMPEAGLFIGQMYITDDGATRIHCHFEGVRMSPYLRLEVFGTVLVDWGDNGDMDTLTGTSDTELLSVQHTYTTPGDYVISITVINGYFSIRGDEDLGLCILLTAESDPYASPYKYASCIKKVFLGSNVTLEGYAFTYCNSLTSITITSDTGDFGNRALTGSGIRSITISNNVGFIGSGAFSDCYMLENISIPNSVTYIGDFAFDGCSISYISIPNSVVNIDQGAFEYCTLQSICFPRNITNINENVCDGCWLMSSVSIPDGVSEIGASAFNGCSWLQSVSIPNSVSGIMGWAFANCHNLYEVHFCSATPPTGGEGFMQPQTGCIIYVPAGSLQAYTTATNYPDSSLYTYIEE